MSRIISLESLGLIQFSFQNKGKELQEINPNIPKEILLWNNLFWVYEWDYGIIVWREGLL